MPQIDTKCNMDIFATWMEKNNAQKGINSCLLFGYIICRQNTKVFNQIYIVWRAP